MNIFILNLMPTIISLKRDSWINPTNSLENKYLFCSIFPSFEFDNGL